MKVKSIYYKNNIIMELDKKNIKRKNPINRNNLFFSEKQFKQQNRWAAEYLNRIINQTVVLYEIDHENTKTNDIYYESNFSDLSFKTPIEINVRYKLDKPELKTYDAEAIKGYYVKLGKLEFSVLETELEENECDIHRGDYIGVQVTPEHMEYFKVADDGRVNFDNAHTVFGYKPYYRSVVCVPVDDKKETVNL